MEPIVALERIATLLERSRAGRYKEQAFRRAADAIRDRSPEELRTLVERGQLATLPGIGTSTARVVVQALSGEVPEYLARLEAEAAPESGPGAPIRAALRGDLHVHSDWSDGGAPIEAMARRAAELGHEYLALTDHSPAVTVAHGLDAQRLAEELDVVAQLNTELAPFRVLTGMEVDILEDGSLDMEPEMLERLDLVVGSVHSKLRMEHDAMTKRMITAVANPHLDVLGHCTGRMVLGRGRPESQFDAELVFAAAAHFDKAIEINCRPERLDPPMRLLELVVGRDCKVAINSDAHAVGQLEWQVYGCERAATAGVPTPNIVNTWTAEELVTWTTSHR